MRIISLLLSPFSFLLSPSNLNFRPVSHKSIYLYHLPVIQIKCRCMTTVNNEKNSRGTMTISNVRFYFDMSQGIGGKTATGGRHAAEGREQGE